MIAAHCVRFGRRRTGGSSSCRSLASPLVQAAPGSGVCAPWTYLVKNGVDARVARAVHRDLLAPGAQHDRAAWSSTGLISVYGVFLTFSASSFTSAVGGLVVVRHPDRAVLQRVHGVHVRDRPCCRRRRRSSSRPGCGRRRPAASSCTSRPSSTWLRPSLASQDFSRLTGAFAWRASFCCPARRTSSISTKPPKPTRPATTTPADADRDDAVAALAGLLGAAHLLYSGAAVGVGGALGGHGGVVLLQGWGGVRGGLCGAGRPAPLRPKNLKDVQVRRARPGARAARRAVTGRRVEARRAAPPRASGGSSGGALSTAGRASGRGSSRRGRKGRCTRRRPRRRRGRRRYGGREGGCAPRPRARGAPEGS